MITILRRLLGVLLVLAGLTAIVVGGWFARALGTDGEATFTTTPRPDLPVVIDAGTNARTDIPLTITATADSSVPVTISIASPSDADALIELTLGAGIEVSAATATLTITPTMQAALTATQTLYWSCKIEEASGVETTIASGTLTLTRRAARDEL